MRRLALAATVLSTPATAQIHARIYPAPTAPLTLTGVPTGAQLIRVATADGLSLAGIERAPTGDRPVLLLLHGNGSSATDMAAWLAPLAARGYGFVAAEYRGYSGNPGRASEAGLAADADAFYARAKALAGTRRVIVVGHSLGGGVAFGLARRQHLDALVTIGTFTRLRELAPKVARAFISDRYDNLAAVAQLDEPFVLIHGLADDVVWAGYGKQLGEAAANAKKDVAGYFVAGADHHPAGETLATIIDDALARLDRGKPAPLPATIKLFAYGRFSF